MHQVYDVVWPTSIVGEGIVLHSLWPNSRLCYDCFEMIPSNDKIIPYNCSMCTTALKLWTNQINFKHLCTNKFIWCRRCRLDRSQLRESRRKS